MQLTDMICDVFMGIYRIIVLFGGEKKVFWEVIENAGAPISYNMVNFCAPILEQRRVLT